MTIVSPNPQDLLVLNLVLTCLMHPFQWQHKRIPLVQVLPDQMESEANELQVINATVPIILGFDEQLYGKALEVTDDMFYLERMVVIDVRDAYCGDGSEKQAYIDAGS